MELDYSKENTYDLETELQAERAYLRALERADVDATDTRERVAAIERELKHRRSSHEG